MEIPKAEPKRKRAKRGEGRLFIRTKDRRELKPGTKNHNGVYYLEYRCPVVYNGRTIKKRKKVKLLDESGDDIITLEEAKKAQQKIIRQSVLADKGERTARLLAELEHTAEEFSEAVDEQNPPLSIADTWDAYIRSSHAPETGQDTLKNYQSHWNAFSTWHKEHYPEAVYLRDITPQAAGSYCSRLKRIYSPTTHNNHVGFLKLLFSTIMDDETIDARVQTDPFKKIKKRKRIQQSRRELTIPELRAVIDNAQGELKTLLLLGASTGLRLGDCCTLRWREVDFFKNQIRRQQNKTAHRENAQPVKVGMPPELCSKLLETPENKRKGYVLPEHAELYTYRNETGRLSQQSKIARRIQKHFEACGIRIHREGTGPTPEYWKAYNKWLRNGKEGKRPTHPRAIIEVGFHSLRHTYVSLQAERGIPQSVVQKIVGHGNPAMTQHYTHITDEAAGKATLSLTDGIMDAEYEEVRTVPRWIKEKLRTMTSENWAQIREELTL